MHVGDFASEKIMFDKITVFVRLTVRVFRGRWSTFVCVLLSLLVLEWGVGCDCIAFLFT